MPRTSGFRCIMVPVDGSLFAEAAIPYALAIAERAHCKVRFVLVHPGQYPPLMIEPASVYLKNLTRRFRGQLGRRLSSIILNGPVAPALVKHAQEIGADLVVMNTHGWGGLRRAWLGSVTDQLIRTIEIPVLVTRPGEGDALRSFDLSKILVPLDGSLTAEVALPPATAMAQLWNAEVTLLLVVRPNAEDTVAAAASPVAYNDELTSRTGSGQEYVGQVVERARLSGAKVSGVIVVGTMGVAQNLIAFAKQGGVSLIAMATHGRGGVSRLVLGSVTNKVVQTAGVPVLVVPLSEAARRLAKVQREMIKSLSVGEELTHVGTPS
jgi:nucleotide-binding universal stress UspA family protein